MDFTTVGPWVIAAASLSALARISIIVIALRGTKPRERPEILRSRLISIGRGPAPRAADESAGIARDP
jgi:hypothetical protein